MASHLLRTPGPMPCTREVNNPAYLLRQKTLFEVSHHVTIKKWISYYPATILFQIALNLLILY